MQNYVVLTGIRRFQISAENPCEAIALLKLRIQGRAKQRKNPEIGMSLVEGLAEGRLNFLVLDQTATVIIAGEFCGKHQATPTPQLILSFARMLLPELVRRARVRLSQGG